VHIDFLLPDRPGLATLLHNLVKEAAEGDQAIAELDLGQPGVIR
jgi:hypothetical protein